MTDLDPADFPPDYFNVPARIDDLVPPDPEPVTGTHVSSFAPVDLAPFLNGNAEIIAPDMLEMADGRCLLHRARLNGIHGDSGVGKSWIAAYAITQEIAAGRTTMVVDLEDTAGPLVQRLRQLGATDNQISAHVQFVQPDGAFSKPDTDVLIAAIERTGAGHVFIDSLGEALAADGINANDDGPVSQWIRKVSRRIISETGAGVTHIDHVTKAKENPLFPSGTQRKRSAITGISWYVYADEAMTAEQGGRILFKCGKDRHGAYRHGDQVALFHMLPGGESIELTPSKVADTSWAKQRDELDAKLLAAIEAATDGLNTRAIRTAVEGKAQAIGDALEGLASRGLIEREDRPRGEKVWRFIAGTDRAATLQLTDADRVTTEPPAITADLFTDDIDPDAF